MIDIKNCCIEGLNIAIQRSRTSDKTWKEQQRQEAEHMQVCYECNPALLASKLFKRQVEIGEQV